MRKRISILFVTLFFVFLNYQVLAYDYFMYDWEKNKILHMSNVDTGFNKVIDMEKCPQFIMATPNPDKFLAVYTPEESQTDKTKNIPGSLIIFNTATGRTEDLVEIGYYPFHWIHTTDNKHFFISCKKSPNSTTNELIHYDITKQQAEKLDNIEGPIKDLALSVDENKLYLSAASDKEHSQLTTITYSPFKTEQTIQTEKIPGWIYVLDHDTVALISYEWQKKGAGKGGFLVLYDLKNNKSIQKIQLKKSAFLNNTTIYLKWLKKERVLFVIDCSANSLSEIYKVKTNGISTNKATVNWFDYEYLPDLDRLYLVSTNSMEEFDYITGQQQKFETGSNLSYNYPNYYYPRIDQILDSDYISIYSPLTGYCKFYSITKHKEMGTVNSGRPGLFFARTINAKTVITINEDKTQYYVLNANTKDITILNSDFKMLDYLIPVEAPLNMFQIKKPSLQTLVATTNSLYKISIDAKTLEPIAQYNEKAKVAQLYEDDNKVLFWTDKEIFVLKKDTFEVTAHYSFFNTSDEPGLKLKKGSLRYNFLHNIE